MQKENENPESLGIIRMEIKKFAVLQYPGRAILHIIFPSVIHKVTDMSGCFQLMLFNSKLSII